MNFLDKAKFKIVRSSVCHRFASDREFYRYILDLRTEADIVSHSVMLCSKNPTKFYEKDIFTITYTNKAANKINNEIVELVSRQHKAQVKTFELERIGRGECMTVPNDIPELLVLCVGTKVRLSRAISKQERRVKSPRYSKKRRRQDHHQV